MRVIGFAGKSGSGKSYRAMWVAKNNDINCIIDDGLLIVDGKILAGKSAKKEKTMVASVKRAIFQDPSHVKEVKDKIDEINPESILIIGTSDRMIYRIIGKLGMEAPEKIIFIEEIATKDEIKKAIDMRFNQGKHVIPVPQFEVKKNFSGYFTDPLKIFFKGKEKYSAEKTIIRPTYSYLGDYILSRNAITAICKHETEKSSGVILANTKIQHTDKGAVIELEISMAFGTDIIKIAKKVQTDVHNALEKYASLFIRRIDIKIISIKR